MTVTVLYYSLEPGYYEDGKFGIRLETAVLVKTANTTVSNKSFDLSSSMLLLKGCVHTGPVPNGSNLDSVRCTKEKSSGVEIENGSVRDRFVYSAHYQLVETAAQKERSRVNRPGSIVRQEGIALFSPS